MNDYGNKEITFTLPQNAPSGKYYAEAKGNHTNYVSGNGFTFFEVGLKEKENLMSYQDRKARGDFDHLAKLILNMNHLNKIMVEIFLNIL